MGCGDYRNEGLRDKAEKMIQEAIVSGAALTKFREFVKAQGGDDSFVDDPLKLKQPLYSFDVRTRESGYLAS